MSQERDIEEYMETSLKDDLDWNELEEEEEIEEELEEDEKTLFGMKAHEKQYEKNMKGCRFMSLKTATIVANVSFGINAVLCVGILAILKMLNNFHFKPQTSLVSYNSFSLWCSGIWGGSLVIILVSYALLLKILASYKSKLRNICIAIVLIFNISLAVLHVFSILFVPVRWSAPLTAASRKNFLQGMNEFFVATNASQFVFAVDVMQELYQCCGLQDYREWFTVPRLDPSRNYTINGNFIPGVLFNVSKYSVPLSCCKWETGEQCDETNVLNLTASNIRTHGCLSSLLLPFKIFLGVSIVASGALATLCVPILIFCFGLFSISQLKKEFANIRQQTVMDDLVESVALIRSKFAQFVVKKMNIEDKFADQAEMIDISEKF